MNVDIQLIKEFIEDNYTAFQRFLEDKDIEHTEAESIINTLTYEDCDDDTYADIPTVHG